MPPRNKQKSVIRDHKAESASVDRAGGKERIAKAIAAAGVCSRRDAEKLIAEGAVLLNGTPVTTPATLVNDRDELRVHGEKIKRNVAARLFLYHKPPGLITTHRDPEGRETVFDHLPHGLPRVVSVGRLDANSEGLLLLTTSGELARQLEHPSSGLQRAYRVRALGKLSPEALSRIRRGITVDGVRYQPAQIEEESESGGRNHWYFMVIKEGKNREIRRIFEHFGSQVSRLIRLAYGPYELGTLPRGAAKEVPLHSTKPHSRLSTHD